MAAEKPTKARAYARVPLRFPLTRSRYLRRELARLVAADAVIRAAGAAP
jgi:hypothetical protein